MSARFFLLPSIHGYKLEARRAFIVSSSGSATIFKGARNRSCALGIGVALFATATLALAFPGEHLASQARITITTARATAFKAAPGKIVSQELEIEHGGSGLRYTFDIMTKTGVREVGVDAKSGAILENIAEKSEAPDTEGPENPKR